MQNPTAICPWGSVWGHWDTWHQAASHTLAQDAETLNALIGQFQLNAAANRNNRQPVRLAAQAETRPASSPAKALTGKLAGAFNSPASSVPKASGSAENWEEF